MKNTLILTGILIFTAVVILGCIGSTQPKEENNQPNFPLTECTSDADCIANIKSPTCCINKDKVGNASSTYLENFCKVSLANVTCGCSSGQCVNIINQEQPPVNGSASPA